MLYPCDTCLLIRVLANSIGLVSNSAPVNNEDTLKRRSLHPDRILPLTVSTTEKHSSHLLSSHIACEWLSINFAVIEKPIVSAHKIARAAVSESILNLASVKPQINTEITQM